MTRDRTSGAVRDVLPLWAGTHVLGVLLVLACRGPGVRALDVERFLGADYRHDPTSPAFGPLWPGVLHVLGAAGGTGAAAVAGLVGALAVHRLAPPATARWTVAWLLLQPEAAFLLLPYSEALFLALASTAWLAAVRDRWLLAGLLASGAVLTRLNGLALALALVVLALTSRRWRWTVVLPFLAYGAWTIVLRGLTGRWDAVAHAEQVGWGREVVPPWTAAARTWDLVVSGENPAEALLELSSLVLLVAATVLLVRRRRWPEATLVGVQVLLLASSTWHGGIGRAVLVTWPVVLLAGPWSARHPTVARPLLGASAVSLGLVAGTVLGGGFLG